MTTNSHISDNALEPGDCVSYRLRRAARLAAKSFDSALRPIGLRNTQFTLLASLNQRGETSIGDLSDALAIDATTLNRNLEVMVRRGLVENVAAVDARVRNIRLTKRGKKTLKEAMPLWRKAQQHVLEAIEPERWNEMREQLHKIETACNGSG